MPSPFGLWANGESGGEEIADPTTAMSHQAGGVQGLSKARSAILTSFTEIAN
jgi:hypothetical protein